MSRTEEQNKALVRQAAETHNARDRDGFLACYADQLIVKSPSGEDLVVTPDAHWEAVLTWGRRFEGFAEEIQQLVAEGDFVCLRSLYSGIHREPWLGVEPTNEPVEWEAWQVLRVQDGLIVEERMQMDMLGLLRQLEVERVPKR